MLVSAIKNSHTNLKVDRKINPDYMDKTALSQNDSLIKSKKASNINFTAYRGVDFYGTPDVRDSLNYKIQLTPEKIDNIMKQAKTTDEGLNTVYKELLEESKNVNRAFSGFSVITKQYLFVAKDRLAEIAKDNPRFSTLPGVGIISQTLSNITGSFMGRITQYSNDLIDDFNGIIDTYFHNGINPIVKGYKETSQYVQDGIEYVNMRKGNSQYRTNLLERVSNGQEIYIQNYKELSKNLEKLGNDLSSTTAKVLEAQAFKQDKRLIKKAIRKLITIGLG